MTAGLPCPNPTCTYTFPSAQVKGAASLKCPKCGTVFQFGSGAAARPATSAPRARPPRPAPARSPVPPPPVARRAAAPRAAARPAPAAPAAVPDQGLDFPVGPIVRPRLPHRSRGGSRKALVVGAVICLVAAGLVAVALNVDLDALGLGGGGSAEERAAATDPNAVTLTGMFYNLQGGEERAFRLVLPRGVWESNDKLKRGLKAVVGLERSDPDAWLAVAVQDFGGRMPREAELIQGGIRRLEAYFGENLELGEHPEADELAGQPAQVLSFRGSVNSVTWTGRCYALARRGLAYWVFLAGAPDADAARRALDELQSGPGRGFVLSDERQGWSEQSPKQLTYAGLRAPFTVRGREGVWESFDNAKDVDPNAELYLHGRDPESPKDNTRGASVLVLALDRKVPDLKAAVKAARDYVEEGKKQEGKGYQLVPVVGKKGEAPPEDGVAQKVGNQSGRVLELQLKRDEVPIKYVLLGVVRTPSRVYVLQCEALWDHHQAWRRDFLDLLGTFQLRGP